MERYSTIWDLVVSLLILPMSFYLYMGDSSKVVYKEYGILCKEIKGSIW